MISHRVPMFGPIKLLARDFTRRPELFIFLWCLITLLDSARAAQPQLKIAEVTGAQVRLSWPATQAGYILESAPNLIQPIQWTVSAAKVATEGDELAARIALSSTSQYFRLRSVEPFGVADTSPRAGEVGVAVTRETIIYLSGSLAANVSVGPAQFYAEFGGRKILSRVELAGDRRKLTLFYLEPIPSGARIRVTLKGDGLTDATGKALDADGDGTPGGVFSMDFETLGLAAVTQTSVSGRVFASTLQPSGKGTNVFVNVPLAGVTITVDGKEESMRTVTDTFGNFKLEPVPAGDFFVHIDGRTVTNLLEGIHYPDLAYYPNVGKKWHSAAGEDSSIGEVYLPLIPDETLQTVSMETATTLVFKPDFIAQNPQFDGVSITVPAGALYSDSGVRGGKVGIAPVPPDRLPGPLPIGLPIQDVITIQTDGGSNFDQPVSACFPNLPDPTTGKKLAPGAKSALWSFNHDTGRFEIVGSCTVSDDGRLVCTDPGVGILAPGWHGTRQGSTASGGKLVTGTAGGTTSRQEKGTQHAPPAKPGEAPPCPPKEASEAGADPVYLFSGEFFETVEDLRVKGRGSDFVWARKYRSAIGPRTRQGNGWDSSYNVYLEQRGGDLALFDGNTREDVYKKRPDGTWSRPEFFRELVRNADGSHTLTFEDRGIWEFHAFDGTAAAGRLVRSVDRNSNALSFRYDESSRLSKITDALGREYSIGYNADGFIATVTDFAGRTIRYEYYGANDTGGGFGDLKSVTTPAVTGTPNGNDFPAGRRTSYTYSTGFADDRLNHNLLTITDGRRNDPSDPTFGEGPYLTNVYASTTDPTDPNFDRVVRQVWGGGVIDIVYEPILPSAANGRTVLRTIFRDRVGNVKEYYFDDHNRLNRLREFTGRADATRATTSLDNRPTGKLRSTDPDFFESVMEWNEDSLQTRVVHPNGNITVNIYESDLSPDAPPRIRGNLRMVRRLPGTHTPVGDQAFLETSYEYDDNFGTGCCGNNFVTKETDARGNTVHHKYDDLGNLTQTMQRLAESVENWEYNQFGQMTAHLHPANGSGSRRRDEWIYYETGPQRGYLEKEIIDATGLRLTTRWEYDAVGNVVRKTDPKGNDTLRWVNSLNEMVRESSAPVGPSPGVRLLRDLYYDANGNVARMEVQNRDENGVLQPNEWFATVFEHEMLNHLTRMVSEVDQETAIATEMVYDPNRNLVLKRFGEAVNGHQPANVLKTEFDERNLTWRVTRAPGDKDQSTTQYDYDANGNMVRRSEGLEGVPRVSVSEFDAYDRPVRSLDPMGNEVRLGYDPNGNRTSARITGEILDLPGNASNARLAESSSTYDEMDRLVRVDAALFDPATQASLDDGVSTSRIRLAPNSQTSEIEDDHGHKTVYIFDSVNRIQKVVDAAGNETAFGYDPNSNLTGITELEKNDLGTLDETFVTRYAFDPLNRVSSVTDSDSKATGYAYDSRHNLVRETDARGNVTKFTYDGINRLVQRRQVMTDSGAGQGNTIGVIDIFQAWDDSSRMVWRTDPNGHITRYTYDPLNRQTHATHDDGTIFSAELDVFGAVVKTVDPNGSIASMRYDSRNRLRQRNIQPGPGVSATTTVENYDFNGLSKLVGARNDASTVTLAYDSLSRPQREVQDGAVSATEYDTVGNLVRSTYPGGRVVRRGYDALDRLHEVLDEAGSIATYAYAGKHRVARRTQRNNTVSSFDYLPSRYVEQISHSLAAGAVNQPIQEHAFRRDEVYNKTGHAVTGPATWAREFRMDSANRMSGSSLVSAGGQKADIAYKLDPTGNRLAVVGGPDPGSYVLDPTIPGPGDAQLNQYTSTPYDTRDYDENGNLTSSVAGAAQYDYRNQLVALTDAAGKTTRYAFDALGRRIRKTSPDGSVVRYLYEGQRVVEERDGAGAMLATYVHGRSLDEIILMSNAGGDFFFHADDLFSTSALTDSRGALVESYSYSDFGAPTILAANGALLEKSSVGNRYLFNGRLFDHESGYYDYRTRNYDPRAGRFVQRDQMGPWFDPANFGNGYTYVANNPSTWTDPFGREKVDMYFLDNDLWSTTWLLHGWGWGFDDMKDALSKIKGRLKRPIDRTGKCGDCLRKLTIVAHGSEGVTGFFAMGSEDAAFLNSVHVNGETQRDPIFWTGKLKEGLAELAGYFCDDGQMILRVCEAGTGSNGTALLRRMADLTGVPVTAPIGKIKSTRIGGTLNTWKTARPGQIGVENDDAPVSYTNPYSADNGSGVAAVNGGRP